jgi:hypothetical protein
MSSALTLRNSVSENGTTPTDHDAPPSSACKSYVYVWEHNNQYIAAHVVNHALPMQTTAFKAISILLKMVIINSLDCSGTAVDEVSQVQEIERENVKNVILLHYVPHHRVLDLTLLDTSVAAQENTPALAALNESAQNNGIHPFLAEMNETVNAQGLNGKMCIELRYDNVSDIADNTFSYVLDAKQPLSPTPELQLFLNFVKNNKQR